MTLQFSIPRWRIWLGLHKIHKNNIIYPRSWIVFRSAPCALSFLLQATTVLLKRQASPLFMTGECLYCLIFLTTLFLTLITSLQVCSHLKLCTIGSCTACNRKFNKPVCKTDRLKKSFVYFLNSRLSQVKCF